MPASAVPGLQFGQSAGGGYQAPGGGYRPPQGGYQAPGGSYQAPGGGYQAPGGGYQAPGGPQFGTNYPRQQMGDDGAGDVTKAWIFAVVSFFCCPFLFFFGFAAAKRAMEKGNPGAQAAKVANIVSLSIWFVLFLLRMIIGFSSISVPQ